MARHYLSESDLSATEFRQILQRATELKTLQERGEIYAPFVNKTLAMIFEKSSTRTRVSFETGMTQLGGHAIYLSPKDSQLGRGEPLEDTARVLSQMVDLVMLRTNSHASVTSFAENSRVPVINGLTDLLHPCQLLADMQTFFDHRGDIEGAVVAWIGDGNNVCNSYINTASLLGFTLRIACPEGYMPDSEVVAAAGSSIEFTNSPQDACKDAALVVTDVWSSMGQEDEQDKRVRAFADYQVTRKLMKEASSEALFMHCLPAHRGEEVEAAVIDDPQSVVWEEAGNRLHAQKALMEFLLA